MSVTVREIVFDKIADMRVAVFMKEGGRFLLALQENDDRWLLDMPSDARINLAMALLKADGAAVNVKLTWPQPKKAKKPAKKAKKRA